MVTKEINAIHSFPLFNVRLSSWGSVLIISFIYSKYLPWILYKCQHWISCIWIIVNFSKNMVWFLVNCGSSVSGAQYQCSLFWVNGVWDSVLGLPVPACVSGELPKRDLIVHILDISSICVATFANSALESLWTPDGDEELTTDNHFSNQSLVTHMGIVCLLKF